MSNKLTKKEMTEIQGGLACLYMGGMQVALSNTALSSIALAGDVINKNKTEVCKCTFKDSNVIINDNVVRGCLCVCVK
jgi:hypothetical protein